MYNYEIFSSQNKEREVRQKHTELGNFQTNIMELNFLEKFLGAM